MKITLVKSSNIVAIGRGEVRLDAEGFRGEALWMYFGKDGVVDSVYFYPCASMDAIGEMLAAKSVGSYWSRYFAEDRPDYIELQGPELEDALAELEEQCAANDQPSSNLIKQVLSALRNGHSARLIGWTSGGPNTGLLCAIQHITNAASAWSISVPETSANELASAVIRILHTASAFGIDIEAALTAMAGEKVGK